jgi:FtsZ-interacting cell division protein ZipA
MRGVTLLLDIPRTRKPARVFNQMIQIARQVAQGIGGRVVDDQRQPLSDAGVRVIAGRVEALETRLAAQQMAPGSVLARRVFA